MNNHEKLLTIDRIIQLEKRLSEIPEIARFDTPGEPQGHTLAHALSGWEDSFAVFLYHLLPRVTAKAASIDDLTDVIHEIGDELRHILYHIHDVKYYGYLLKQASSSNAHE